VNFVIPCESKLGDRQLPQPWVGSRRQAGRDVVASRPPTGSALRCWRRAEMSGPHGKGEAMYKLMIAVVSVLFALSSGCATPDTSGGTSSGHTYGSGAGNGGGY